MGRKKKASATQADSGVPQEGAETVQVNENENQEAVNGTTQEGSNDEVQNTDSIPQNGQTEVETTPAPNDTAEQADESRSTESIEFADESNPNQKARNASTGGEEFDQDGNPRTGGYSYGVAADDTSGTTPSEENKGVNPDDIDTASRPDMLGTRAEATGTFLNPDEGEGTNENEWSEEDQRSLEESLSDPEAGIKARVVISAGKYVSVKFYRNNLAFGTFKTRNYSDGDAQEYLNQLKKDAGL